MNNAVGEATAQTLTERAHTDPWKSSLVQSSFLV